MRIGERVMKLLEEKGLKQVELARYLGVGKTTVNSWKKENCNPTSDYIVQISEFLGVSIEYLFTGKESENIKLTDLEERMLKHFKAIPRDMQLEEIGRLKLLTEQQEQIKKPSENKLLG